MAPLGLCHLPASGCLARLPPSPPQDTWLPEQVAFVSAMGNARANAFWEARLPPGFRRPPENDMALLRAYITDKYVERRYAAQGYGEPPGIDNYTTHPVRAGACRCSGCGGMQAAPLHAGACLAGWACSCDRRVPVPLSLRQLCRSCWCCACSSWCSKALPRAAQQAARSSSRRPSTQQLRPHRLRHPPQGWLLARKRRLRRPSSRSHPHLALTC